jgi:uncharacterized membrane protein YccC
VRPYGPESAALAALYADLARSAAEGTPATEAPPSTEHVVAARTAVGNLAGDRSVEAERYLALFGQAERARLAVVTLHRLRTRMAREPQGQTDAAILDFCFQQAAATARSVASALETRNLSAHPPVFTPCEFPEDAPAAAPAVTAMRNDARWHLDALAGQLRSAVEMAAHTTPSGMEAFELQQAAQPRTLRLTGGLAVLRANLTLRSTAFRHALRLAACVALADLLARAMGWNRPYWAPMTVAIVLKPDFTATFSRGVLRLAGTFAGLGLATVLSHLLSPSQAVEATLITAFLFLMRWAGGANYGLLVTPLSALVVFLFALSGTTPAEVINARAINTVAGGVIALTAYRLWPTWERAQIGETLATLFDEYRSYFQAVRDAYLQPGLERQPEFVARLALVRQAGRLARTNLEAAAARFSAEPGVDPQRLTLLPVILANSHRFIHAVMALEAGLSRSRPVPARQAFSEFANGVDTTLYFLSAYLRGSPSAPGDLPDLRQIHHRLVNAGDSQIERYALVNVEADRITNSTNSLAVEVLHWVGSSS